MSKPASTRTFSMESIYRKLDDAFPNGVVDYHTGEGDNCVLVQYDKTCFPQVSISVEGNRVCWKGFWKPKRWGVTIENILGLTEAKYVLPWNSCKMLPPKYFDKDDPRLFEKLQDITSDLFERSNYCALEYPPIPEGYRLATPKEIELAK